MKKIITMITAIFIIIAITTACGNNDLDLIDEIVEPEYYEPEHNELEYYEPENDKPENNEYDELPLNEMYDLSDNNIARPARNPQRGELNGFGNDGIAELQFEARYLFEYRMFPDFIFEFEDVMILILDNIDLADDELLRNFIEMTWFLSVGHVIMDDLYFRGLEIPETEELRMEYVDNVRNEYGLGVNHIGEIHFKTIGDDTNAIIIELKDTNWALLGTYIGIAYNERVGLRYFTTEKSHDWLGIGEAPYIFCGRYGNGMRGSYFPIENSMEDFIAAIKAKMQG